LNLIIKLAIALAVVSVNAQEMNYTCTFTSAVGSKWSKDTWNSTSFAPQTKMFVIKTINGNIDVKSVAEYLGGWGGKDASCNYVSNNNANYAYHKCTMLNSSRTFMFNSNTKNGALVNLDGVMTPDTYARKDDIGIEVFKCL